MCTWIVHLRIADACIKRRLIPDEYKTEFVIGSVAPDCGYGTKDAANTFDPPPTVTHLAPDGNKRYCGYAAFYDTYLCGKPRNDAYFFALGYYIHLVCDVLWSVGIYAPVTERYKSDIESDPSFITQIKSDWQKLDFAFLRKHPDFEPYGLLCKNQAVRDYMPFYEPGQLTTQTRYIADYYRNFNNSDANPITLYLSESEVEDFICRAMDFIYTLPPFAE